MPYMFLSLLNSNSPWHETHSPYDDALTDPGWIRWFLEHWGFGEACLREPFDFKAFDRMRTILADAADTLIMGKKLGEKQLDALQSLLGSSGRSYRLIHENGRYTLKTEPLVRDWHYVISEITASFVNALEEFDAGRFKRCENPDCRSFYYDSSKNRTRRWCCNGCSSLIKVRRFREKKKQGETSRS